MTRIYDLIIFTGFIGCLCCALYIENIYGDKSGYERGRLSVFESLMQGAVQNMAALPIKDKLK